MEDDAADHPPNPDVSPARSGRGGAVPPPPFDAIAQAYAAMTDWDKRLANERPFYESLIRSLGARRVLDTACGTGHHAAMLHDMGMAVEAADIAPAMIEQARRRWTDRPGIQWIVRGFDEPVDGAAGFDLIICVGNSLALAPDRDTAAAAIARMIEAAAPGGAVVIQVLNLYRLPEGLCQWQKCQRAQLAGGDSLIIKGVHRGGDIGYVDMLVTSLAHDPPVLNRDCIPFLGLDDQAVTRAAARAGAARVELFGSYRREPYERETSPDLLAVVRKPA